MISAVPLPKLEAQKTAKNLIGTIIGIVLTIFSDYHYHYSLRCCRRDPLMTVEGGKTGKAYPS